MRKQGRVKSLNVQACMTFVHELSTSEVLKLAEREDNPIGRFCANSDEFWRAVIEESRGEEFFVQRQDVEPHNFRLLAANLDDYFEFHYRILISRETNPESKLSEPFLIDKNEPNLGIDCIDIVLDGLEPMPGTVGFVAIHSTFRDNPRHEVHEELFVLADIDADMKIFEQDFKMRLAKVAWNDLRLIADLPFRVDFSRLNTSPEIASKDEFIEAFMRHQISPDPNVMTEIHLNLSDNTDESQTQFWIVRVVFD